MTHKTNHNFTIGQTVRNFGQTATVTASHPVTGDLILQDADGCRWIADPAKCEVENTAWQHKDGLAVFA